MKILFMNFLRLGDLLMMAPVLNDFRKKFPHAEFHYLCFEEFQAASQVLDTVDQWHFISRQRIQRAAADPQQGLLSGVDLMKDGFDGLNELNFDLAVNLSHTRFSALAMSLISAPCKEGVYFEGEELRFSSPVFRRMNDAGSLAEKHYLDWYRQGFGFDKEACDWTFRRSSSGPGNPLQEGRRLYLFQTLSSDGKKSWSLEKWLELFQFLRRQDPLAHFQILCAPFEIGEVEGLSKRSGVPLLPTRLDEAHAWIQKADYLVTVDTSLKHLANGSPCRVIELCLGSSDLRKQSIHKAQAVILAPNVSCHPCAHAEICPLETRICSGAILPEDVLQGVRFFENSKSVSFQCKAYVTTTRQEWACRPLNFQGGTDSEKASSGQVVQSY